MADQEVLFRVLRTFVRTMANTYEVSEVLTELSHNAVEVFGASAAGVALCDDGELRFLTATNDLAAEAEEAQERLQSGPCWRSLEESRPVPVSDLRERFAEWPEYGPEVVRVGFPAVLGLPLVLDSRRIGSLDVYDEQPREWTQDAIDAGTVLADIASAFVLNASEIAHHQRTTAQLQAALDSRIVIEQAKGRLIGELGLSSTDAFERIRRFARSHNQTVADTSRAVLERGAPALGD